LLFTEKPSYLIDMNWNTVREFEDIIYEKCDGIAKVTINRPHRRNAFTPDTVTELIEAFTDAREDTSIGVVLLTGFNPQTDGKFAFCAGGDQKIRGHKQGGYIGKDGRATSECARVAKVNSFDAKGRDRTGRRLRDRRRACIARRL
jgi:1,4-dihydroxy-2-naphthoyl-CoA synthase